MLRFDFKTVGGGAFAGDAEERRFHLAELLIVEVAAFHQQAGAAGNNVECARLDFDVADVKNAVAEALADEIVTAHDKQRRAAQGIAPLDTCRSCRNALPRP